MRNDIWVKDDTIRVPADSNIQSLTLFTLTHAAGLVSCNSLSNFMLNAL